MLKEIKKTGILNDEILTQIPGYRLEDLKKAKGPLVMIECAENIPCNPCETICPSQAIVVGDCITNLPTVNPEKCTGCGMCVAICPGLAIFVVNLHYKPELASVMLAYEYLPAPVKGASVIAVDRAGQPVCEATVEKVVTARNYDRTKVMTISFPVEYAHVVRGIQRVKED